MPQAVSGDLKQKLLSAKNKAQKNLVAFRYLMCQNSDKEVLPTEFHYEWSDLLLNGKTNTAIEGFRESAKTNYAVRAFLLYCLCFPSKDRDYIILIKANETLARNKLHEIEREYLSSPILRANLVKVNDESQKTFDVDVKDVFGNTLNIRIEAYGKGASIRGLANVDKRPSVCVIDDPQDIEDAQSDTVQENDWNWFLSDIMFLGQYTRIFLIGNNLGERSIVDRIFKNASELRFETHKVPILINGVSAWPSKFTLQDIEKERDDYRKLGKVDVWYRERMCEAISDETRAFDRNDFLYYDPQRSMEIARRSNVFIACDLAISEDKKADFTSLMVVAIDKENFWFVLDCVYGRFDPSVTIDHIFSLVSRYKPMTVGIEKVAYQKALIHFIEKEKVRRNIMFTTKELEADRQKELRIMSLQPRFRAKQVYFPEYAEFLTELETELLMFPKCLHDDIVDALAYIPQMASVPVGINETDQDVAISHYRVH